MIVIDVMFEFRNEGIRAWSTSNQGGKFVPQACSVITYHFITWGFGYEKFVTLVSYWDLKTLSVVVISVLLFQYLLFI